MSDLVRRESAAKHLRSQQTNAGTDGTRAEDLADRRAVMIYGDVKVLTFKRDLPGRALEFAWASDTLQSVGPQAAGLRVDL